MKKPYQIDSQRAVKQLEAMAVDGNPAVHMVLPMAEMLGWLHKGVGELISPGRSAVDGAADGSGSSGTRGGAESAADGSHGQSLGQRARLLRGDGAEGADRTAACASESKARK
jgi:hypothetical protein